MRRLGRVSRHVAPAGTAAAEFGSSEEVEQYRALGLEWAPTERLPPPTADVRSADAFDIPDPPQTGAGARDMNSPLGQQLIQGFGEYGTHPIFDPHTQEDEAFEFYQRNGYCVIKMFNEQEIADLNAVCDEICAYPERITTPGQGDLVFPLVHYPEVDFTVTHPSQKPLVSRIMGGWEHVRMIEFNYRGWDPERHAADRGMVYHPDGAAGISLQEYATRVPYGPPDNLLTFMYLTDVDETTPAFAVVPKSRRAANIRELKEKLGDEYREVPIMGPAGSACIMDANIIHTRLDPIVSQGTDGTGFQLSGRRIFHHVFANARQLENADGSPRTPNVPLGISHGMYSRGIHGPRLTESKDPEVRKLYSWWSSVQFEWKETGYDPDFIGDPKGDRGPIRGRYSHPGAFKQD